mmetsp:Transcript_16443/g.40111  ORF Transcript_16443/g.40111 Transcript_16443/m.40111 type:complete len:144 (+) Transcript_16443:561-992(+)
MGQTMNQELGMDDPEVVHLSNTPQHHKIRKMLSVPRFLCCYTTGTTECDIIFEIQLMFVAGDPSLLLLRIDSIPSVVGHSHFDPKTPKSLLRGPVRSTTPQRTYLAENVMTHPSVEFEFKNSVSSSGDVSSVNVMVPGTRPTS